MLRIDFSDSAAFGAVPGSHQIAVVGESGAKEGMAIYVIGSNLQTESAFQTFGRGVLLGVVTVR